MQTIPGYDIGRMGVNPKGQTLLYRKDLHYQDGSSDKIYIVTVSQTGAEFYAEAFYCRRGAHANRTEIGTYSSEALARSAGDAQARKKEARGYKPIGQTVLAAKHVSNSEKYTPRIVWPMNAQALDEKKLEKLKDDPDWIAEVKEDGVRLTMHITPKGNRFFSRSAGKDDPTQPLEKTQALQHLANITFPDEYVGIILDVEALADGMDSATISGHINALDGRDNSFIYLKAFDLIQDAGGVDLVDLEWKFRRQKLTALINKMAADYYGGAIRLPIIVNDWVENEDGTFDVFDSGPIRLTRYTIRDKLAFHAKVVMDGGEGTMWKNINAKYKEGARPANTWYKLKKEKTDDVIIIGYTEGQGKYQEQIGAVVFAQYVDAGVAAENKMSIINANVAKTAGLNLHLSDGYILAEIGQCSGMTDTLRADITNNWDKYLGRVIEVEYMERTKTGALRHPRWLRVRDDKTPEQCIWEG